MTKFDLSKIDLSKIDMTKINTDNLKNLSFNKMPLLESAIYDTSKLKNVIKEMERANEEAFNKKEQYEQDVLNTLRQIEGNTANLTTLVNLIQKSNDNQGEILEVITELLALAKEKDPEVVDSKYRKIMNKITTFTEDVNTMTTLISFGTIIINILKSGA